MRICAASQHSTADSLQVSIKTLCYLSADWQRVLALEHQHLCRYYQLLWHNFDSIWGQNYRQQTFLWHYIKAFAYAHIGLCWLLNLRGTCYNFLYFLSHIQCCSVRFSYQTRTKVQIPCEQKALDCSSFQLLSPFKTRWGATFIDLRLLWHNLDLLQSLNCIISNCYDSMMCSVAKAVIVRQRSSVLITEHSGVLCCASLAPPDGEEEEHKIKTQLEIFLKIVNGVMFSPTITNCMRLFF